MVVMLVHCGPMACDFAALNSCMSFFLTEARAASNDIDHPITPYNYSSLNGFDDDRRLVRKEEGDFLRFYTPGGEMALLTRLGKEIK